MFFFQEILFLPLSPYLNKQVKVSRKSTQKRERITLFGEKMVRECQSSQKINSYMKYETNSAAKRKAIRSQKLDFYLQTLAKWSFEKQPVAGVSLLQRIEFYTKTR